MNNIFDSKKFIQGILFLIATVFLAKGYSNTPVMLQGAEIKASGILPYSEGGMVVEDPGLQGDTCRYVDSVEGNDSWPGTKAQPWKSLAKSLADLPKLPAGTHILLRRGCSWNETWESNYINGAEGRRYVLGSYGPVGEPKPRVIGNVRIRYCSYWMVRDLDVNGQLLFFMTSFGVIFNNEVHGWGSNGIAVMGGAHHIAVVQNLIYDGRSNDGLAFHDSSSKTIPEEIYLGNNHWIVDNIVIGNDGIEECLDVASNGWREGYECTQDIKIINNRLQCRAVQPSTSNGSSNRPFNLAHTKKYVWVIGNIGANGDNQGIYVTDNSTFPQALDYLKFSSNIIFSNSKGIISSSATNTSFKHNTLMSGFAPAITMVNFAVKTANAGFSHNLIVANQNDKIFNFASGIQTPSIDYNWYSPSSPPASGQNDLHSGAGAVPGVEVPPFTNYNNNPANWYNTDFLEYFIPDSSWAGNDMAIVPGAFRADGSRQGLEIEPFLGYENNGYGWEGPLIIQERYPLKGLNTGMPQTKELQKGLKMSVFPNPSKNENLSVKFELHSVSDVTLKILSGTGQEIKSIKLKQMGIGEHSLQLDKIKNQPGMYILQLAAGKETDAKQIIVH